MQPLWKTVWRFLKKLKIELPYNPTIAQLGIYPKDTERLIRRCTCTPMFIAVLSTIAKLWKEPKCPSTDECIKWWYIHTHTHKHTHTGILSSRQKNEILLFAMMWMELQYIMLSEINQSEKEKKRMISLICEFKKQNSLI